MSRVQSRARKMGRIRAIPKTIVAVTLLASGAACAPTVKVQAPDEPIVIDMNVKIQHEVLIKVDREVEDLLGDEELFGASQ